MPRVIQVIESTICRGKGTNKDNIARTVTQFHSMDGEKLGESDPVDLFRDIVEEAVNVWLPEGDVERNLMARMKAMLEDK